MVRLSVPSSAERVDHALAQHAIDANVPMVDREEAVVLVAGLAQPRARAVADRVLAGAERLEHAQAVLVDVDAGPGGAQALGALVQAHAPAALRERAGCGQPCETAADDLNAALHLPQNIGE